MRVALAADANGPHQRAERTFELRGEREADAPGVAEDRQTFVERGDGCVRGPVDGVAPGGHGVADDRDAVAAAAVVVTTRLLDGRAGSPRRGRRRHDPARLEREPELRSARSRVGDTQGRAGRGTGGHEADELGEIARSEQRHRVDVAVADAQPEVQDAGRSWSSPDPPA